MNDVKVSFPSFVSISIGEAPLQWRGFFFLSIRSLRIHVNQPAAHLIAIRFSYSVIQPTKKPNRPVHI